jgi:hypothetical protein
VGTLDFSRSDPQPLFAELWRNYKKLQGSRPLSLLRQNITPNPFSARQLES